MNLLQHNDGVTFHKVRPRLGKKLDIHPDKPRPRARYFDPDSLRWWRKGVRPRRDSFRQRCYDAERALARTTEQKKFANITEVAKYVRDFMEKPWFQRRYPLLVEMIVRYKPGTTISRGGPARMARRGRSGYTPDAEVEVGRITLSSWGMGRQGDRYGGELVVLHELAHAVLPYGHHHDRRWARTFLEFVGCMMGQPVRKELMRQFREHGVPFSPFKQVEFTEQQLERLAAARPNPKGAN